MSIFKFMRVEKHAAVVTLSDHRDDSMLPETILPNADWNALQSALNAPSEPNEALKSGFRWYQKLIA